MKIVFVLPPYDYSRSVGSTRKKTQIGLLPPLGVGYLAAALEAQGHEAALVDAVAEQIDTETAATAVLELRPDLIGVSSFTTLTPNDAYPIVRELKRRAPDIPVIMGGPHVTSFARQILEECPEVDVLIPGDAELVLTELVRRIENHESYDDLRGILYRTASGEGIANPPADVVKDIDRFPHPARHIYKHERYCPLPSLSARRPATSIITARGCPWASCRFCYQGGEYASPYRRRSPENVVDEIRQLVREYGIRNLVVWDDNFCVMPSWIDRFCDLLDAEDLDVIWSVLARANTVTPEMLKRMAASGCYSIQFGVESGNQEILDLINKGHTLDQCRQAVRWSKEAGMDTRGFFVLGFPTETPEMSRKTIDFACELNMDYVVFFSYYVAPGTKIEELALREGQCRAFTGQQVPSYVPNTYPSAEELEAMVQSAYRRYYLRPAYIARAIARAVKRPSLLKNHAAGFYYWLGLMLR
ncbi:MAG TPA: radical SAM protein [Candidatus Hydrogenedentes bacterium]|nr:radical SAM protein [Candidatus Hydrogenedentota bacterium]HPG65817.1 radical SAM protein [Candidatus Hydrogenedentota bacterium]